MSYSMLSMACLSPTSKAAVARPDQSSAITTASLLSILRSACGLCNRHAGCPAIIWLHQSRCSAWVGLGIAWGLIRHAASRGSTACESHVDLICS